MAETPADKNLKYQVFISFKNTDASGKNTLDAVIAEEVYDYFTKNGIKVFFSKVTLANLGTSEYQKQIYDALDAAEILVIVATKSEHVNSKWVEKEWMAFDNEINSKRKPNGKIFNYFSDVNMNEISVSLRNTQTIYHTGPESIEKLFQFINNGLSNSKSILKETQAKPLNKSFSKTIKKNAAEPVSADKNYNHGIVIALIALLAVFALTIFFIPGKDLDKIKAIFLSKNYYESGMKFFKANNYKEAKKEFTKAIEAKPLEAKSYFQLGITSEKLLQTDEAVIYYQKALELDSNIFEAKNNLAKIKSDAESKKIFYSARELIKSGNYKGAIDKFKEYLDLKPESEEAYYNLGIAYEKIKADIEAINSYEKVLKINPAYMDAKSRLKSLTYKITFKSSYDKGIEYSRKLKYDNAIEEFKKALEINPQSVETHYNLAVIYEQLSRNEEALREFKKIIIINSKYLDTQTRIDNLEKKLSPKKSVETATVPKTEPGKTEVKNTAAADIPEYKKFFNKGLEYINEKKFAEAVEEIRKAIRLNADSPELFCKLGVALEGAEKNSEALDAYNIALNLDVNCTEAKLNKDKMFTPFYESGLKLEESKKYQEAVNELECALKIKSDSADLLYHLGINCAAANMNQKAVDYLNRSLQFRSNFPDTYKALGKIYINSKENNKAVIAFRKLIQLVPGDVGILRDIGSIYKKAGIYAEAAYIYKEITRLEPHDGYSFFNLGFVSIRLRKYEEAINAYLKVLNTDPKNVEANYEIASAYFKIKDYKNARKFYESVTYINPDHQEAKRMIDELNKISRSMR